MSIKDSSLHRLSVGTLIAVIVQIAAVVWWASGVSASVESLEISDIKGKNPQILRNFRY